MADTETDRRKTRGHGLEGVVVVGDVQLALVLAGVVVGVTDQGTLPLRAG